MPANTKKHIIKSMEPYRNKIAEIIVKDEMTIPSGTSKLEAAKWLVRISHHIACITFHMEKAVLYTTK